MSAADEEHRALVAQLQDRLSVLESEASKHSDVLNATVTQNKSVTDKLTEEKAMLEVGRYISWMALYKTVVTPLHQQWSYHCLVLSHKVLLHA